MENVAFKPSALQMIDNVGLHVGSTLGPAAGHTVEGRPIFHPGSGWE